MKKKLDNVTLIAVSGNKYGETLNALHKSMRECEFARVIYLTDTELVADGIEVIKIRPLKSWEAYNDFIMRDLYKYFDTSHCLLIQHDGFVINGDCWDDKFLDFDDIGALWLYTDGKACGNGGCSLRSHKLQKIVATDKTIEITAPEDEAIGRLYRTYLEDHYNIRFGTDEICNKFAFELREPVQKTFAFHGYHWHPFQEHIIIKRTNSMGDIVLIEPLIDYYSKKGFQVVMDIPANYMNLFFQYHYKVKHINELKPEITPIRYIDLDMSYEKKPKQLILKSYYEAAGIKDGEIRNSRLSFPIDERNRLFKKYVVVHIDDTAMPHRNIRGVDWKIIVIYLNARGYEVFQIGKGTHEECGIFFNAANEPMMMYLIAGASLFISLDSGPAHIAVSLGVPAVIAFGSVNPRYRYHDFEKIRVVQNKCMKQNCYHSVVGIKGVDCHYDIEQPPCTYFEAKQFIDKINELI